MQDDNRPKLTVVGGKESKAERRSGKTPGGLTAKQHKFAEGLAAGLNNAEAYRAAYDASGMAATTVNNEASKLAARPDITATVAELLAEKRQRNMISGERQADRVWRNVWRLAEGESVPPAVQQSALALAAKMAGLLTEKVEVRNENIDSKSIEAELLQRLQKLAG